MRFQVKEFWDNDGEKSYYVEDSKLDRSLCECQTKADATTIAQALELQEVATQKTLEQIRLDFDPTIET